MPCKTLRIGVFFDGTGNTRERDKPKGRESNIAKLSELYYEGEFKDKLGLTVKSKAFYINGVGTYDTYLGRFFNLWERKYDKGGGGGGAKRINKMIEWVTEFLDKDENRYSDSDDDLFSIREIDVFGFSRGSATARDFVNTFFNEVSTEYPQFSDVRFNFIGIYDTVGSFGQAGDDIDMKPTNPDIVDETYLSHPENLLKNMKDNYYGMRDYDFRNGIEYLLIHKKFSSSSSAEKYAKDAEFEDYYTDYEIEQRGSEPETNYFLYVSNKDLFEPYNFSLCSKSANKIVHITAHDEVRKNFPSTNIKGSGGDEYTFMGVHSDIGGGYSKVKTEKHELKFKDIKETGLSDSALKARGQEFGEKKLEIFRANDRLLSPFWKVETAVWNDKVKVKLKAERKINNRLANVTLHILYEEAVKYDVPFRVPLPNDDNHNIPDYLESYYNYAKESKASAYKYLDKDDGKLIKRDYIHHSAVDPLFIDTCYIGDTRIFRDQIRNDSADGEGNDTRYINSEGKQIDGRVLIERNKNAELMDNQGNSKYKVKRAIYDNKPNEAVIPKENKDKDTK